MTLLVQRIFLLVVYFSPAFKADDMTCRLWDGRRMSKNEFQRHACSYCYHLLPNSLFQNKLKYDPKSGQLVDVAAEKSHDPSFERDNKPFQTFANADSILKWKDCCAQADKCCSNFVKNNHLLSNNCPRTWDGFQCWPEVRAGTLHQLPCPQYFYATDERSLCPRYVKRKCDRNGTWSRSPRTNQETVDYSTCRNLEFKSDVSNTERNLEIQKCCRTERQIELSEESYRLDTCARCYMYLPPTTLRRRFVYNSGDSTLRDPDTNISYYADWQNNTHPIYGSFLTEVVAIKWVRCCQAAMDCCFQAPNTSAHDTDDVTCPRTWDGWQCFPETPSGSVAHMPCAEHVYFTNEKPLCPKFAEKICMPNGEWYYNGHRAKEWTSYISCGRVDELKRQMIFHIAMYAISVIVLIPALLIFFIYKQLQVFRITMHKQFFFSLLFNGVTVVVFKSVVMMDDLHSFPMESILDKNETGCKILFLLTKYFRLTNYMWMFSEGFYLHKLISAGFVEQRNLLVYYMIGWAFPLLPTIIYGVLRKLYHNERCWVIPAEEIEWIVNGPNLFGLVTNLIFLCDIIRILITKLRATHATEPSQYRKAVRATLVLVPLFGLHFLFILYRPKSGSCNLVTNYTYFTHALDGLQGFLVSLIFCYVNGEVLYLMKRSYQRYQLRHNLGYSVSNSLTLGHMSISTRVSSVPELRRTRCFLCCCRTPLKYVSDQQAVMSTDQPLREKKRRQKHQRVHQQDSTHRGENGNAAHNDIL